MPGLHLHLKPSRKSHVMRNGAGRCYDVEGTGSTWQLRDQLGASWKVATHTPVTPDNSQIYIPKYISQAPLLFAKKSSHMVYVKVCDPGSRARSGTDRFHLRLYPSKTTFIAVHIALQRNHWQKQREFGRAYRSNAGRSISTQNTDGQPVQRTFGRNSDICGRPAINDSNCKSLFGKWELYSLYVHYTQCSGVFFLTKFKS